MHHARALLSGMMHASYLPQVEIKAAPEMSEDTAQTSRLFNGQIANLDQAPIQIVHHACAGRGHQGRCQACVWWCRCHALLCHASLPLDKYALDQLGRVGASVWDWTVLSSNTRELRIGIQVNGCQRSHTLLGRGREPLLLLGSVSAAEQA